MLVTVDSRHPKQAKVDLLVLPMTQIDPDKWRLPPRLSTLDKAIGGGLSAILRSGDFRGSSGQRALGIQTPTREKKREFASPNLDLI